MSDILSPDEKRGQLRRLGVPESLIDRQLREEGERLMRDPDATAYLAKQQANRDDDARLETAVELAGDKQLRALGFEVVRFSHPGRTKQTPGIPDRRYYHRGRRLAFWWEAKSATGTQRPDQKLFHEMCDAVGDPYVLGTDADLFAWLIAHYPLSVDESGHLIWRSE